MLIDVQDDAANQILNGCLLGIVLITLLSVIPWRLRDGRNRWTHLLPLMALTLYVVYEITMPARMNIRLDLILVLPLITINLVAWLIRLARIRWLRRNR